MSLVSIEDDCNNTGMPVSDENEHTKAIGARDSAFSRKPLAVAIRGEMIFQ
jgi:hypothetical protein